VNRPKNAVVEEIEREVVYAVEPVVVVLGSHKVSVTKWQDIRHREHDR